MALLGSRLRRGRVINATGIAAICILLASLLLVFVPSDNVWVQTARDYTGDFFAPVYEVAAVPFQALRDWRDMMGGLSAVHEDNEALRRTNAELIARLKEMEVMRVELQKYKDLLAMPAEPSLRMVSARVVADFNSPFVHTLLANNGAAAGIAEGQAVIGAKGLVGRVLSVSENTARILLLSDFNSHIPVITRSGNTRAILSGRNRTDPILSFLPRQASLADGEELITSGDGGQIPAGLPVGVVSIDEDSETTDPDPTRAQIILHEDLSHIDYVRIIIK